MPIVDLAFRLAGSAIPADHAYLLYAAVTTAVPTWHGAGLLGLHPVNGRPLGGRSLQLTPASRLTVRLHSELIPDALPLAGLHLRLGGSGVLVGVPEIRVLVPAERLVARLVVIKGFMKQDTFLSAAQRQLHALGVKADIGLVMTRTGTSLEGRRESSPGSPRPVRRTLNVKGKEIVGFAVTVAGLDPDGSARLQEAGLGGRRHFGCGLFLPARPEALGHAT